jgi:DNA-binding phage protein
MSTNKLIEYMKLHLISLEQDYEVFYENYLNDSNYEPEKIDNIKGQMKATRHLMSVASDMIRLPIERI